MPVNGLFCLISAASCVSDTRTLSTLVPWADREGSMLETVSRITDAMMDEEP